MIGGGLTTGLEALKNLFNTHAQVYRKFKSLNNKFVIALMMIK